MERLFLRMVSRSGAARHGRRQVPVLKASKKMPICATAAIESAFLDHECKGNPSKTER